MNSLSISICICTSGRPGELRRCLASVAGGSVRPLEVVVSDDSRCADVAGAVRAVCSEFDFARYVEGPRRGLCVNRNHVIRHASGTHVSLLDDDAVVGHNFLERATALVADRPGAIFSGDVMEDGTRRVSPTNPTFLGHFGRRVRPGERLENICLNCNVLPRAAFDVASFDESIAYGYEDTDLCAQLLAAGFEIVHAPELVNQHLPPPRTKQDWAAKTRMAERARLRVLWRKWRVHRGRPLAAVGVLAVARAHALGHGLKSRLKGVA